LIPLERQLHLTRTPHGLSNEPLTKLLYAAPNFLKIGDKVPKFVVFWTISTIKDEKSAAKFHYIKTAAKFHYIKTVSGKVVAQSIAFRVVIGRG